MTIWSKVLYGLLLFCLFNISHTGRIPEDGEDAELEDTDDAGELTDHLKQPPMYKTVI